MKRKGQHLYQESKFPRKPTAGLFWQFIEPERERELGRE